ncbi:hypothetical protein AAY473_011529 [Plecturocebus cupreus]
MKSKGGFESSHHPHSCSLKILDWMRWGFTILVRLLSTQFRMISPFWGDSRSNEGESRMREQGVLTVKAICTQMLWSSREEGLQEAIGFHD